MITIVGIRFRQTGKVYYFDPAGFDITEGMHVIVETARGMEYGEVASGPSEVNEKSIVKPLKKVIRIANREDETIHKENMARKQDVMNICQKKIDEHKLEMKLKDVEYTFDNSKIIFYFTADGRVDFRSLVKDLASIFRVRIELRQVGVRDEARMLGGIGTCGRVLCCHTWLGRFNPVSIKMAKTQGMSLNPTKISGICGRLMCCLKYENDEYCLLKKGLPVVGERVKTPDGPAVVTAVNILKEQVSVRHFLKADKRAQDEDPELSQEVVNYSKYDVVALDGGKRRAKKEDDGFIPEELRDLED